MPLGVVGIRNSSPAAKAIEMVKERSQERVQERREEIRAREEAIRMRAERSRAQRMERQMQGVGTVVDIMA